MHVIFVDTFCVILSADAGGDRNFAEGNLRSEWDTGGFDSVSRWLQALVRSPAVADYVQSMCTEEAACACLPNSTPNEASKKASNQPRARLPVEALSTAPLPTQPHRANRLGPLPASSWRDEALLGRDRLPEQLRRRARPRRQLRDDAQRPAAPGVRARGPRLEAVERRGPAHGLAVRRRVRVLAPVRLHARADDGRPHGDRRPVLLVGDDVGREEGVVPARPPRRRPGPPGLRRLDVRVDRVPLVVRVVA